jgi:hypothetical protein
LWRELVPDSDSLSGAAPRFRHSAARRVSPPEPGYARVGAGADGQPGPVPVAGPVLMAQAGQSATVTSVPLTVTTAAGVDASRHRV